MNIEEQFNLVAKEYDVNRRKFIPCFDEYYIGTTCFLASMIKEPKHILDLGAGTGLLSAFWEAEFPEAEYLLVDIASEMLEVAKKRFLGNQKVAYEVLDYSKELPEGEFDVILSGLSIHHLSDEDKTSLFGRIYEKLQPGGIFINYDQFCAESMSVGERMDAYWVEQIKKSGLSKIDIERWEGRRKLDQECSITQELDMLSRSKFSCVECIYANQKFTVLYAEK